MDDSQTNSDSSEPDSPRQDPVQLQWLIDAAPIPLLYIDTAQRVVLSNEIYAARHGRTPAELKGLSVREYMGAAAYDAVQAALAEGLAGHPFQCEQVIPHPRLGTRCTVAHYIPDRAADGSVRGLLIVFSDITDRRRAEALLRENERTEAERLAAIGRMAGRIAHEINNPLAGIKNSFALIKDGIPATHPYFSYVVRIEREIDRIVRITRQMFNVYRPEREAPRPFVLQEIIQDVVGLVGAGPRRKVSVEMDVPAEPVVLCFPEDSVRQILFNLLQNAVEASPEGGEVQVGVEAGDAAVIWVADQGGGIAPEVGHRVFEPFFTTKDGSGRTGLGLGLPISRSLAMGMGGSLQFESCAGGGTIFRLYLPRKAVESKE